MPSCTASVTNYVLEGSCTQRLSMFLWRQGSTLFLFYFVQAVPAISGLKEAEQTIIQQKEQCR